MSTLMSCVRKEKMDKFKELLPEAKPEHVNQSLIIAVRDEHMMFFKSELPFKHIIITICNTRIHPATLFARKILHIMLEK
jgi:hypothetical protein